MRRFTHLGLPLLGFALALAAGAWFSIERRAAAFSAGVDQRLAATAKIAAGSISDTTRAFSSDAEMLTVIMSAASEDEPLLRAHRLHEALSSLTSAELAALFDKAAQVEDRERRGALLDVLLARWAVVNPVAAEAAVRPFQDRFRKMARADWRSLDTAVCLAWARAVPERALAEALTAPDLRWASDMAHAAIASLAEGDPVRQLETLTSFPASDLRGAMCETAIKALAEKDCAAAEARLDLLTEPRQRARVQSEILGKLAERDPVAALARLATLAPDLKPGADGIRYVNAVLGAAAKKDPEAALEAVNGLPEALQSQALGAALVGWAREHPIDALTWAATNGIDMSDAKAFISYGDNAFGWNSLLSVAFDSDRKGTLAWLRTQPPSPERDSMLRDGIWSAPVEEKFQMYAELTPNGKAAVASNLVWSSLQNGLASATVDQMESWVKAQPPGAARTAAIQAFASLQSRTSEDMETLANNWPVGPDRDAALRGIVWNFTNNNDPRSALDFARRVSAPEIRQTAFEGIAQSWLYHDEPAARAWILSTPEISVAEKRVLLRQFDER